MTAGRVPGSARRLALTSLGAGLAVVAAAPVASAATTAETVPMTSSRLADNAVTTSEALTGMATPTWARLGRFRLYPLAGTGIDPLSNVVGTNLGGVPVSTQPVTDAFSDGLPLSELPVIGTLLGSERD